MAIFRRKPQPSYMDPAQPNLSSQPLAIPASGNNNSVTSPTGIPVISAAPTYDGFPAPPTYGGFPTPPTYGGFPAPPTYSGFPVPPTYGGFPSPVTSSTPPAQTAPPDAIDRYLANNSAPANGTPGTADNPGVMQLFSVRT